jgi:hypothetical protein
MREVFCGSMMPGIINYFFLVFNCITECLQQQHASGILLVMPLLFIYLCNLSAADLTFKRK